MNAHFITYRPNRDRAKPNVLDRYDDFLSWKENGRIEGWSARKTFQPGDLAIFYMASPLRSIVGLGLVDSDPYYEEIDDPADFKNPVFCDFRPVLFLNTPVPIKDAVEHQKLHTWWHTRPYQSIRRIELSIAQALLREISDTNQDLTEIIRALDASSAHAPDAGLTTPPKHSLPSPKRQQWDLNDLLHLNWSQFELLVSEVFRLKNKKSKVELTPKIDYGVDIVITLVPLLDKEIVQCKRYRPDVRVSSPDMQKFIGAMAKFKAKKGYFVTTSTFSRHAKTFAQDMPVELIDGQSLVQMIADIQDFPSPAEFGMNE